ncbi:MAG: DUF885 domain-containing protein [Gammaproteobacteria bacterium HGW-Gammaproteobacteria-4]|jgi:uncharacterized protein (DUF885 family)|nr:MAG: DUF885 domain-containing protein [Gammaproteobacteria bacterium HGW-Gammaproteobacteria-4]
MRARLFVPFLCIALAACGGAPQSTDPAAGAPSTATETAQQQLEQIYAQYWEAALERNPLRATFIGDPRYNDRLPNTLSPAYRDASKEFAALWLERVKAIGPATLDPRARVSYDVFVNNLEGEIEGYAFRDDLMPLNQFRNMASTFAMLGAGTGAQPFRSVDDYDNWLARASQIPALFDQAIANMRDGVAQGLTQPRVLIEKAIPQFDALIADDPEKTVFWKPIENLPAGFAEADRTRLRDAYRALIADTLMPAYRKLRAYAADEYLPATRDSVGLGALPDGEAWYAYLARQSTTTDLSPEQIHQIGLDEVARIHDEMRKVMRQTGFTGELKDYFTHLKADPANYFDSEQDMLDAYRGFRATIEPLLPALFDVRPKADFEIRPVEAFRAASAAGGSYQRPAQDGSRPGIFYANTYDLKARPRYALESLFLHEAEPGHHFQIALQQELTELPAFRRFGGETAFAEGWGLYAESLGKELGVYTDPVMYFGALDAELWRAIRLVVDTGIHAKGWSRQQVLDYMYANSPTEPTRAIAEAERFMAIPGQALAYKIGQIRIRALRTRAEAALGERFDVRAFHREVLNDGTVPMKVLEAKIERWIAAQ